MKTCYINVSPEQIRDSLELLAEKKSDSVLVLAPVAGFETYAPSKKKPNYRIKAEIILPEYAIVGESCLTDFGIIVTLTIPENRINPGYLKERNAAKNQVAETYNPASGKE